MFNLFIFCFVSFGLHAFNHNVLSEKILSEYKEIEELTHQTEPDYLIAGFTRVKKIGDVKLIWLHAKKENQHQSIRLMKESRDGSMFSVTYHRSSQIFPGRIVIRRFIGHDLGRWVNDTIDYHTGEYLGRQGSIPFMNQEQINFLSDWRIEIVDWE